MAKHDEEAQLLESDYEKQAEYSKTKISLRSIAYLVLSVLIVFCIFIDYNFSTTEYFNNVIKKIYSRKPVKPRAPLPPLLPGLLEDPTRRLTRKLPVSHVFIVNAYYYPTSKSLGPSAVALNMVVDARSFNINNAKYSLIGSNGTHEQISVADSQIEGVIPCRYAPTMAKTNTVRNMTKLEMESNGTRVEIPFKMARYTAPKPVVICISPQFVAEQWQLFMMQVHVTNRFGGHLHIYVTSIIESYFELMKVYEKQGYITIDFWLRMKFVHSDTPYFEPNINTELRNQAGAQTDCLLQYKEAAQYIAFFDLDDILFPMMYPSYVEEFNAEWSMQPNASSIVFKRREHEFIKAEYLSEFSFYDLISSLKSSTTLKAGKIIVKPNLYNSTWIHASQHENPKNRHRVEITTIVHVQRPLQKHSENNMTRLWKMEFGPLMEKFRPEDIKAIEEDIWRIRNISKIAEIAPKLPSTDFYLPIVFKCYYDVLYGPSNVEHTGIHSCPNAESCKMPQRDEYKCLHADAEYHSGPHMKPFTYHFSNNSFWSKDIGCYQ